LPFITKFTFHSSQCPETISGSGKEVEVEGVRCLVAAAAEVVVEQEKMAEEGADFREEVVGFRMMEEEVVGLHTRADEID
jgi:hypothetical protein